MAERIRRNDQDGRTRVTSNDRLSKQARTRRAPAAALSAVVAMMLMALTASPALADVTHPFVGFITLPSASEPQPAAVDDDGNLIVWLNAQKAVGKFDVNGNPVNFTGLGTHILDGAGGFDCPNTPSDCDRAPTNGFGTDFKGFGATPRNSVAVDHSGGPADDYIYVQNNTGGGNNAAGEIDVFDETGRFKGTINQAQAAPNDRESDRAGDGIWVTSDGFLYSLKKLLTTSHIDRYRAVDADPAHTVFVNQARQKCGPGCISAQNSFDSFAAGPEWVYVSGNDKTNALKPGAAPAPYMKFHIDEFRRTSMLDAARSVDFSPEPGPFEGAKDGDLDKVFVDPLNEHVYIGSGQYGFQEWNPDNEQIGPMFAEENIANSPDLHMIAFDRSGGATDGRIYIPAPATNQIAVFGSHVTIPDIEDVDADTDHTTATITATIGTAGGPDVDSCEIQYGTTTSYGFVEPCDVPTPYASDTGIEVDVAGLAVGGEYHYRIVVENANGKNPGRDHVFLTEAVLDVTTEAATDLTPNTATLNGSLDPDGMATEYYFDWGAGTNYTQRTAKLNTGPVTGQTQVTPADIEGLQPGRTYHFRLVGKNSLGTTRGPDMTFTVPASPRITSVRATNVADTSADLNAQVNPFGFDTDYFFEYGPTRDYGLVSPTVNIGSGISLLPVTRHIDNLQSGLTYHFRVVATNQWGTSISPDSTFNYFPDSCPNAHVRQQTAATLLPDCRAYELVSPARAGGVLLYPGALVRDIGGEGGSFDFEAEFPYPAPNPYGLATNPSRFGYFGGNGGVEGLHSQNVVMDRYLSTRTTTGWVSSFPGMPGDQGLFAAGPECSTSMSICIDYPTREGTFAGKDSRAPMVWSANGNSLGRWPTNLDIVPNGEEFVGDHRPSPNFTHFVFSSREIPFAPGGLESAPGSAYDNNVKTGTVKVSSLLPNGDPLPQDIGGANEFVRVVAVSNDGSHILMSTAGPSGTRHLYMRVGGMVSHDLTGGVGVDFVEMTADGSKVAFTSAAQLTGDDTDSSVDMFLWEEGAAEPIVRVSQGNGKGNTDACTTAWTSVCDVESIETTLPELDDAIASQSGDIFFYSPEQLDASNPGVLNERNLYQYRDGEVQYVTTFDPETQAERMQISASGNHAAFLTTAQLTDYENTSPNNIGVDVAWAQMYAYDARAGEVVCASCIPTGEAPMIEYERPGYFVQLDKLKHVLASQSGRFMSDDGRVAFTTADALVPRDTNGKLDIYEFVDNRAQLITTGVGEIDTQAGSLLYPTTLIGLEAVSRDGIDIYFSTFETLVAQDGNGAFLKFYDARTNGGFPVNPPPLPCAAADECHGDTSKAAPEPEVGTGGSLGATGNAQPVSKPKPHKRSSKKGKRKRAKKRGQQARAHRGGGRND
jgi:hypothetical protein